MSGSRRLAGALAVAAALVAPAPAGAQAAAPSLTVDTSYAFAGVSAYDFTPGAGVSPDVAAGAAADAGLDRLYAVGTTASGATGTAVAIVARTAAGSLDQTFAGDGSLALPVRSPASARGADIVVLPDHRLRVVGTVDTGVPGLPDLDVVVLGLRPDGSPDTDFGTNGVVTFGVGPAGTPDVATGLAVDAAGRLAITGGTGTGAAETTFVAVREPDGSAAAFGTGGVVPADAPGDADRGADVVWGPRGPLVLTALGSQAAPTGAVVQAFTATGAPDGGFSGDGVLPLDTGGTATTAGALALAAGRVWATGGSVVGSDTDAYLVRADLDGGDVQLRRFDMRGSTFPASTQVATAGTALTAVPGDPETLVVGGETATDSGTEVSAAAFNLLDGPVAGMQATDVVIPVDGQGSTTGIAPAGAGSVALTAALRDFSTQTGSGSNDTSIGMGRLLVDAEKRCDLRLTITGPLELRLRGRNPGAVALSVVNTGQRACSGTIAATAPFALAGQPVATGRVAPGATVALPGAVTYAPTALPARGQLELVLDAPGDVAPGDNVARVGVRFAYCDLRLRRFSGPASLPTEGRTTLGFSIANRGTAKCRTAGITVAQPGVRTDKRTAYTIPAGQSVTEDVTVRLARRTRPGRKLALAYTVPVAGDARPADNVRRVRGAAVRPGDTDARTPTGRRLLSGRARAGRAAGVPRRTLRVRRVQVALQFVAKRGRKARSCRWLAAARGSTQRVRPGARGRCDTPVWVTVRGTKRWSLKLRRRLPAGRFKLLSRAILVNGVTESVFSRRDGNQRTFTVRARTTRKQG